MSDLQDSNEEMRAAVYPTNALAAARKRLGYSQEDLAEILKVERSTIGRWERGTCDPSPWIRPRLAKALQISLDELARVLAEMDQLAKKTIGEATVLLYREVRRLREEAGLSQPELAQRIGYTRQYVSHAERPNKNLPSAGLVKALDKALDAKGALVTLRARAREEQGTRRSEIVHGVISPARDSPGKAMDAVDRREFVSLAATAILGMTTPFHITLPTQAGESDWRNLLDRTARLRRLDNHLGGRDTYNLYASELSSTVKYVRSVSCSPKVRTALVGVVSEQAQLAGWAAFDAGMHTEARKHYTDSLEAAKEAENAALAGNALAFLAYQEVSTTGPNVGLAEAAFDAAEKDATPRVLALLLERKAWTHAVAGEPEAVEKSLAAAKAAIQMRSDRPEPDWVFWVDENEIEIMSGRCWAEFRRPLRAVPVLETALDRFDDTHARDKALYITSLAHALIDGREIERAASVTQECIRLAHGVGSVRPCERIGEVLHRLQPFKGSASVSQVLEQVQR